MSEKQVDVRDLIEGMTPTLSAEEREKRKVECFGGDFCFDENRILWMYHNGEWRPLEGWDGVVWSIQA